jgi:HK97 family phage major capsid protein
MLRSQKLMKQIDEITAKQVAILEDADKVNGGKLTDEQSAEFDRFQAEADSVKASREKALSVEEQQRLSGEINRVSGAGAVETGVSDNHAASVLPVKLPANVRSYGQLKAFKGADAAANAYAAGMWVMSIFNGDHPMKAKAADYCRKHGMQAATLNTGNNEQAGYLVPTQMDFVVAELTEQYGVFRRNAEIVPMTSGQWSGPRWTGGMTSYWVAEMAAPTQSDPRWDRVNLVAKDLAAMTKLTNQLNEDSVVNLGDKVAMALAVSFAAAEDQAGFDGDGTSTYGGIVGLAAKMALAANAPSVITAGAGRDTLPELILADFNAVIGAYPEYAGSNPKWYCHKNVWALSMVPLQLASGGATAADISNGGSPIFLGYPVEFVQARPSTYAASTYPIFFGDLNLSSKMGVRRERGVQAGWVNDDFTKQQFTLLGTERVDINNHTIVDPTTVTLATGVGTKAGPIMALKLAA